MLYSEATDPDSFLRSSGQAMAVLDHKWKTIKVNGKDPAEAIAELLEASLAHLDAMAQCGLRAEALPALLNILVAIDMSGVDTRLLGLDFLELHKRYFMACAALRTRCEHDDYTAPHAAAILRMEAALYLHTLQNTTLDAAPRWCAYAYRGLGEAANTLLSQPSPEHCLDPDPLHPAEALVDSMARLHAIGLED